MVESNGSLPPNVICGLIAKKLGSAPCPTPVIGYGTTLLELLNTVNSYKFQSVFANNHEINVEN